MHKTRNAFALIDCLTGVMVDGREHIPRLYGGLSKQLPFPTNKWLLLSLGQTSRIALSQHIFCFLEQQQKKPTRNGIHYAG